MRNISTKYNSWSVTDKGDSPCQSIYKYSIPSPNLKSRQTIRKLMIQVLLKDGMAWRFYLNIYFECNICKILLAHLKNMLSQTTLGNQS